MKGGETVKNAWFIYDFLAALAFWVGVVGAASDGNVPLAIILGCFFAASLYRFIIVGRPK